MSQVEEGLLSVTIYGFFLLFVATTGLVVYFARKLRKAVLRIDTLLNYEEAKRDKT